MKFNIFRDLSNEVYSVKILFSEFGSDEISAEAEEKIMQDHGSAVINLGGRVTGKYVDGVLSLGELGADEEGIAFDFIYGSCKTELTEGMEISYSISADSIVLTEKMKEVFDNKAQVAEQYAELFILHAKYHLEEVLDEWHALQSDFDSFNPEEFIV